MGIQRYNCIELLTSVEGNEAARSTWEEWDSAKSYLKYNKVAYQGSSYSCIADAPAGTLPTDETYWICIAEKGEKGDKGDTGEKGNVMYAVFDIDADTGELAMTVWDEYTGPTFDLDENGYLGVLI